MAKIKKLMHKTHRQIKKDEYAKKREQAKTKVEKAQVREEIKVDKELEKKLKAVTQYNNRMKALISATKPNKEERDALKQQVMDVVPNSDLVTKGGYISTAKKYLKDLNMLSIKTIEANTIKTVKEMKDAAMERFESSGIAGEVKVTPKMIMKEILSENIVKNQIDDVVAEWYEFTKNIDPATISDIPELRQLDKELYSSGVKTYTELQMWMSDALKIMH